MIKTVGNNKKPWNYIQIETQKPHIRSETGGREGFFLKKKLYLDLEESILCLKQLQSDQIFLGKIRKETFEKPQTND